MASINVFTTGLANKLGVGGMAREYILDYIPAMVYVMYDGYYIYTPTYVPETVTNENGIQLFYYKDALNNAKITPNATQLVGGNTTAGEVMYKPQSEGQTVNGITFTTNINNAKKTYKHVLKTFVPYSSTYTDKNGKKYVINYTLDNYVRIIGNNVSEEGYIMKNGEILVVTPNSISIKYNGGDVLPEVLEENIAIRNSENEAIQIASYKYVYNSDNEKRYYDDVTGKFFIVNNRYVKIYMPEVEANHQIAEYKKILITENNLATEYIALYQLLNINDGKLYRMDEGGNYTEYTGTLSSNIDFNKDYSAKNYYVEMYCFNNWLNNTFGSSNKSKILEGKNQYIIEDLNNNLKLSMANYSANSSLDYKLPEITEADWEQALSNISIITFFQGAKIGLKTYNNYVVVTSNENNEFISENSLYYYDGTIQDKYYHVFGCIDGESHVSNAYLNIDFKPQTYTIGDNTYRYYKHCEIGNALSPCFNCIVNTNNMSEGQNLQAFEELKTTALARERYIKISRTRLTTD